MGRVVPVIAGAAAASAGCAQIAGIDETSSSVSVALTRMSVGTTLENAPLELTGLEATFLVANGGASRFDRVPAATAGDGTWTSKLAAAAPVQFTLPDEPTPRPRMFAFPSRALSILYAVLEHPGRAPAPEGAMLEVTVPLDRGYVMVDDFQVYTVGSWTERMFIAAEIPQAVDVGAMQIGPVSYAFSSSSNIAGRPKLDRLTTDDTFLVLRYADKLLTGVAKAAAFNQVGTDTVTTEAMNAVTADQMLDVKLDTMLATRFAAARPAVSGLVMNWSLVAAPGYRIASNAGPALHSGSLTAADTGLAVMYGNPFVTSHDWRTIFTLATRESRDYTPSGATIKATLLAGMDQLIEPSPGYVLKLEAGLPVLISLDGKPLSTDGQTIQPPTTFVPVTFVSDSPSNTLYEVQVYDLLPNMAGTLLEYHFVFAAASNEARFDLPPEVFEVGHSYTIRALTTAGGYPTIASGNFLNRELPLSQSFLDSAVFTVTP